MWYNADYILQPPNVYCMPNFQYILNSVKLEQKILQCLNVIDNDLATLVHPKFQFKIDDEYDMLIFVHSLGYSST